LALSSEGFGSLLAFFKCLAFFSNFGGSFWSFLTEGLAFFEKINLATLHTGLQKVWKLGRNFPENRSCSREINQLQVK